MTTQTEAMKLALESVYETITQWDEGGGKRSRRELARRIVALAEQPALVQQCTRSHPHESMDAMCELRTEIARLTNENARLKALVQQILSAFPLFDDEGLDEEKHCCEWTLQQDRKRLHAGVRYAEAAHGIRMKP